MAEVEVALIEDETEWAPYLSVEDANKLDDAKKALRTGDLKLAGRFGRIFELHPITQH